MPGHACRRCCTSAVRTRRALSWTRGRARQGTQCSELLCLSSTLPPRPVHLSAAHAQGRPLCGAPCQLYRACLMLTWLHLATGAFSLADAK